MVARDDGVRGGKVCEEEGSSRGVEVVEFKVEGGRTRFARRKVKNASMQIGRKKMGFDRGEMTRVVGQRVSTQQTAIETDRRTRTRIVGR
jgi:hypothetical protein